VFDCLHGKEIFPNAQPEPPLTQLCDTPSYPTQLPWRRGQHYPLHSHPQELTESKDIASEPPFLRTRQDKCPQPLLKGHAFQLF